MADAKRIAKNTVYMYFRMILVMAVTIYTSRVILDKLGVDDYGLYNAVASVVAVMSFLNSTLSTSTSRFLTFELGRGNFEKLQKTFSTAFFSHLMLAILIILTMESIGLWYISNKFVIPEGRETATHIVFQLSVFTTSVIVCQVPYTGSIMAHENLNVYAYLGIFEVVAKLMIVYLLSISPIDKLVFYAILLCLVQISITTIYWWVCRQNYQETRLTAHFSKNTFKGMLGFTGWTAVANVSNAFIVQGAILLLNLFFSPAIVAAKALANQITQAIMQFVNNFRVAMNPQIIKSYAAGNYEESKFLTLKSTLISFDLMLIIGLPFVFTMKPIMHLWLVEVPPQAVLFTQVAVVSQIFNTIPSSTYIPFVASGKQKNNAILGLVFGVAYFVVLYAIYKLGGGAIWVQYLFLIYVLSIIFFLRPYLLHKEMGYKLSEVLMCYWQCLRVFIPSFLSSVILYMAMGDGLLQQSLLFILVLIASLFFAILLMEKNLRRYIFNQILQKIKKNKK